MISFTIFNLNIMHGRNSKSPIWPLRFSRKKIENNLQKIVSLAKENNPDVITLQEVDQSSVMSGNFNQFDFLDIKLDYPHKYFAPSCSVVLKNKKIFVSGNAIFSKYPLKNCKAFNFDFSFPTERQGFVVADLELPDSRILTITSIHLVWIDWVRLNSRARQLNLIQRVVTERKNPHVIAGDMNCGLSSKETSLRSFVNNLELNVPEPKNRNTATSPSWNPNKRIDWVFVSKEMNFISYKTLQQKVSDHLAILAEISI